MIYLDHHAATPLCAQARAAMTEALERHSTLGATLGNPSSAHRAGQNARALLERARDQVAAAFGCKASEVVLTSGGTESCNLAICGLLATRQEGARAVTTAIEHPAVAQALAQLERARGLRVTRLELPAARAPSGEALAAALGPSTDLCAIQWVNHETGTVLPIDTYAEVCRAAGVALFVDAVAGAGKLALEASALGADLIAIASHKLGGPAGAGALIVRRGCPLEPQQRGGSQERGLRAGSPDLLAAVGFGAACAALGERLAAQPRLERLRAKLEHGLRALGLAINAEQAPRVATVVNASWPSGAGSELVAALDLEGVCVSSGAACSSGVPEPSPVLRAMYPTSPERARGSLRLSFGPETQESDVDFALAALAKVVARGASPSA